MTKFDPRNRAPEPTLEPVDFDPFAEAPKDASFALTEAQRELWTAVQMGPEVSCAYNQCLALTVRGEVSVDALRRAVQRVFDRHDSLRTRFDELGQSQTVQAAEPLAPSVLDLSGHRAAERPQRLQEVLDREVGTPLDLVQGPVARVTLVLEASDLVHLVFTAHHIVFDGHSSDLFFRELAAFYSAERTGSTTSLPPATPFRRQVELEQSAAGLARAEAALGFWKTQLSTGASALQLPTDHPCSARPSYRGKRAELVLTRVSRAEVTKVASRLGATSTGLLLAAFQTLLYRLTGQGDVVVGLPVSARPTIEGDSLMGHATNLLATRTRLDATTSFADVVRRARATLLDCHDHQSVTFGTLLRELDVPRDQGRTPLVAAVFNVGVPSAPVFPGAQAEIRTVARQFVNFDLELQVVDTRRELMVELAYSTDLFEHETVERWLRHYEQLLTRVLINPDERISELPLLTEAERTQIIEGWNSTRASYPREVPLARLVEEQVARTPDAVAVVCGEESLTFAQLNARANQLARTLVGAGAGPDQVVGLFVERSANMVAALLAIVKAGAAYLPLDPHLPEERIQYMLEDSGAQLVVSEQDLIPMLPAFPGKVVSLDDPSWASNSRENLSVAVSPEALAYVIYTSGSTGKPKGVEVPRGALINLLSSMRDWLALSHADRLLAVTTISFDIAGLDMWGPLLVGARMILATRDEAVDGVSLRGLLDRHGITFLQATPVTWRLLLEAGWKGSPALQSVCTGEAMPRDLAATLAPIVGRLWNLYGPTETTIWSTGYQVRDGNQPILIGRPVANTQCYILDENRRPVPIGVVGELYIGGDGLARGYHGRPELTVERFLPDPFSAQPGARMYRTGDLTRYLADGNIECLGRTDHQVKIRGYRIELGEIETALVQHAVVRQAVVVVREDTPGEKRLVAYLVTEQAPADLAEQLRASLHAVLPDYMVPSHFVVLASLPLTASGKVDRKALPAPSETSLAGKKEPVAPRNPTEEALAALWAELLHGEKIGIHDNLFELGAHSLLVIKARARIRDLLHIELPTRKLFENPTIASLAAAVAEASSGAPKLVRVQPRQETGPCPLSFSQEQFWLLDQMAPGSPAYNVVDVMTLPGSYHGPALQGALDELARRHEILRTTYAIVDGQLMQEIHSESRLPLTEHDVSSLPEDERTKEWNRIVSEDGQRAFDLASLPLIRATVVHTAEHEHRLLFTLHHIAGDEWSMGILQQEVGQLYQALANDRPSALTRPALQYADYACWQRAQFSEERLAEQVSYWKKELEGATPALALPTDKVRPPTPSLRGATELFTIPKTALEGVRALEAKEQVTSFMLLEAAFAALMSRYSGQNDILVGTPISSRTESEVQGLIGCFLNSVVLRSQFAAEDTFRTLLQQTRQRALGAFAHAQLPFTRLVATAVPDRDSSRTPLFQVMFILHDPESGSSAGRLLGRCGLESETSKFDLTLHLTATRDGFEGLMEYSTDLFEPETVRRICRHFRVLLEGLVREPDRKIADTPLLTDEERSQILVDWNATEASYPRKTSLAQLIEEQVARTPDAVAVVFGEDSLTFAELNGRANQLARSLVEAGAGPNRVVGLYVERSVNMLVALLAIVKSGAAYLPLDPLLPEERIQYMLEDSGASLVLTEMELEETLPSLPGTVISLDEHGWKSNLREDLAVPVEPEHLAYLIYTSGSTGKPKGVEVLRGAFVNFLWSMRTWLTLAPEDRWLAVTTISFDIAGLEIWLPLLVGARVVIASRDDASDGTSLCALIEEHDITCLQATPITWRLLLEAGWNGKGDIQIICGGEALPRDLAVALTPIVRRLWNLYGPTETTVWSTGYLVRDGKPPILIGRPIANTQCYVLDENRRPIPIGVVGELYIGGDGLARGYHARPELTAERFLPDPFSPRRGARMYRTGDLARYLADGNLECLGRTDHQVKVRGHRIELGEIEAALMDDDHIQKAVVAVRADALGDARLVAYVVFQSGRTRTGSEMRRHLAKQLPEYMLPHLFVELATLPQTPSGKVDRKALPEPFSHEVAVGEEYSEPRTPMEKALAELWGELLKLERVSRRENFFALGGHSLLAAQMVAQLFKRTGHRVGLRSVVFETLEQIAANCHAQS